MPLLRTNTPLDLADFLPHRLAVVVAAINRALARRIEDEFQLSSAEWRCLSVLGQHGGLSSNALAERTNLDKVGVSRALARLVDRGLVKRDVDPADRRALILSVSPAGRDVHEEATSLALAWESDLIEALGVSEIRALDRVLDKLERAVERLDPSVAQLRSIA